MSPNNVAGPEYMPEAMEEEHGELLAKNIFTITMLGSVAFVLGCWFSMMH